MLNVFTLKSIKMIIELNRININLINLNSDYLQLTCYFSYSHGIIDLDRIRCNDKILVYESQLELADFSF